MDIKKKTLLDVQSILSKNGISRTDFRTELLNLFYSSKASLSVDAILKYFDNSINKVTVYRSLKSFENKGLIHKVPDKKNLLRYSLCSSECGPGKHSHDHAHLLCSICDETFCLDDFLLPNIKSHNGYVINNYKIILEGSCLSCQAK